MRYFLLSTVALACAASAAQAQTPTSANSQNVAPSTNAPAATPSTTSPASTPATDAQSPPSAAAMGGLGEIVVTAQRRSENLQRAAIAVDVVSASGLLANQINSPTGLGQLVPALTPTPAGFFLRGVGNFTVTPYADPAVAFNYDGVYIGRPASVFGLFFDLQRVEVLKGPQGTLYGRNATGGAINVIPVQPKTGTLGGYLSTSYGNYNAFTVEGAVNAPLGQDGALRVSGQYLSHDGYLSDNTSDQNQGSVRVQLLENLTPSLTVRVAGDYEHLGGNGGGSSYVAAYRFNRVTGQYDVRPSRLSAGSGLYDPASQAFLQSLRAGPAGRNLGPLAPYPYVDSDFYGTNAEISWKTDLGTLTVIPAYRHADQNSLTGAPAFVASLAERDDQYSVETRFAGKRISIFDYTIGGFFFDETNRGHYSIDQQALAVYQDFRQSTTSYAAFARVTANLAERLRLVGGVRYTNERKTFNGNSDRLLIVCTAVVAGVPTCPNAPLFPFVDSLAQQTVPYPPRAGLVVPIPGTGAIDTRGTVIVNARLPKERVTYRGAVEFDLARKSLVYGSVETGFRSGGFSLSTGYETYQPEYLTAFTIGSKNRFFQDRLQLNLEAFIWKYRDQQLSHVGIDLAGQTGNFTQNIGRTLNKGFEIEGRVLVTPTTVLNIDYQYLDARYQSFRYLAPLGNAPVLTGCAQNVDTATPTLRDVDCSGRPTFNSPESTLNLGGQQTVKLGAYELVASVDTQYKSGRYVGFDYLAEERVGHTWQTNAQLNFGPIDDQWSIGAFIINLEDNRFATTANLFGIGNVLDVGTNAPRTYGVRLSGKF